MFSPCCGATANGSLKLHKGTDYPVKREHGTQQGASGHMKVCFVVLEPSPNFHTQ